MPRRYTTALVFYRINSISTKELRLKAKWNPKGQLFGDQLNEHINSLQKLYSLEW